MPQWILFFTAVIGSGLCFFLYMLGQSKLPAITVSFLGLLDPIFAMIGAAVIPDPAGITEPITGNMLAGSAIILLTLSIYLKKSEQ